MHNLSQLNWIAVVVAALAGYFPGAIWYSPVGFLRPWARELSIDVDNPPAGKHVGLKVAIGILPALAAATVFALILGHPGTPRHAMGLAIGIAGAFISTSLAVQYLYEGRSLKFWLINSGYHMLQYVIMGLVLSFWP
jgi:hypothetical protein